MDAADIEQVRGFYEDHRQALYTYALSLTRCRSAAEDAVHTVFCRLLKQSAAPREMRPYIFRAVRNAAVGLLRENHRAWEDASIFAAPGANVPHEGLARRDEAEHLLQRLSEDERECVVLKIFNGLTFDEIASVRRVSINTAASWYRRGLAKMKTVAEEEAS